MTKVMQSEAIKEFSYTREIGGKGTLKVRYKSSNAAYMYEDVPYSLYIKLKNCKSTGSVMAKEVRNKYKCYRCI